MSSHNPDSRDTPPAATAPAPPGTGRQNHTQRPNGWPTPSTRPPA